MTEQIEEQEHEDKSDNWGCAAIIITGILCFTALALVDRLITAGVIGK